MNQIYSKKQDKYSAFCEYYVKNHIMRYEAKNKQSFNLDEVSDKLKTHQT